jgi:predicted enzyme related to lactoylglutathione lyase
MQAFYSSLFPSWTFKQDTAKYPEESIAMWSFAGPSGLSGGIIKVDASCKTTEQPKGVGITVYHFVESIDDVSLPSPFFIISKCYNQADANQSQKRVEELGGVTCSEKTPEGENGWFMYLKDVAGNRFGIYEVRKEMLGKPDL